VVSMQLDLEILQPHCNTCSIQLFTTANLYEC